MNYEYNTSTEYSHTHSYPEYLNKFDAIYFPIIKAKEHFSHEVNASLDRTAWYFAAFTLSVKQKKYKLGANYLKFCLANVQTSIQKISHDNLYYENVLKIQTLLLKVKRDYIRFLHKRIQK